MIGCVRKFEKSKIITKVQSNMKKSWKILRIEFDSKPVHGKNDKYIKSKLKIYSCNVNTNFQDKKMLKEKASCKCLHFLIMLDSVIKGKKKNYDQTLLGECKYEPKKIKMENLIDDKLEKSSSNESDNEDDNNETESDNDNDEFNE